ncbi:MAG: EamA family transporter [Saprospiraceae bacterium]
METWIWYALFSAIFAGLTSVLAKFGMSQLNADQALSIRVFTIASIVIGVLIWNHRSSAFKNISNHDLLLLIGSGITTSLSWIFYYRAMKDGLVSYVASIDKLSIVITLVLSFLVLKEPVNAKVIVGTLLIVAGVAVLLFK